MSGLFDHNNRFEPGTAEHFTQAMVNQPLERRAESQQQLQTSAGWGGAILGIGLLLFGLFGSWDTATAVGHVIVVAGVVLLGIGIALAGYRFVIGLLIKMTGRAWGSHALARSVMAGAVLGMGCGAWLGYSMHELMRGIVRLGLMGTLLGLVIGVVLLITAKASKRAAN